ncbi:MAG TPA: DUF2200 family protein [Luteibaculaceae bacterium]|nr:DUF2200 family protein [Luteibaculaceae bacterium]
MKATAAHHERIAQLTLASVYPHYVQKIAKKGRTEEELLRTIEWLTGHDARAVEQAIADRLTFQAFFQSAKLNPKAHEIKGLICGYRIEEIDVELTRHVRYLDKLVDDLAKGKVRY